MEARYQEKDTTTLKNNIFGSFPGADQLALLLIARYHVESNKLHPTFGILYPLGRGEDTIPSYENQPIGKTIAEHIHAVGGSISQSSHRTSCLRLIPRFFPQENPGNSATLE